MHTIEMRYLHRDIEYEEVDRDQSPFFIDGFIYSHHNKPEQHTTSK